MQRFVGGFQHPFFEPEAVTLRYGTRVGSDAVLHERLQHVRPDVLCGLLTGPFGPWPGMFHSGFFETCP